MRNLLWLSLCGSLFIANLSADSIQYTITNLGSDVYEYNYFLSGEYDTDQVIQIDLCSAVPNCTDGNSYSTPVDMSNAGNDWSTFVYQPDPAVGEPGSWVAESLVDDASLNGPFSVEFQYSGSGTPGAQSFSVLQFDSNGNQEYVITSGTTTLMQTDPTPEPASFALSGLAVLVMAAVQLIRKKRTAGV